MTSRCCPPTRCLSSCSSTLAWSTSLTEETCPKKTTPDSSSVAPSLTDPTPTSKRVQRCTDTTPTLQHTTRSSAAAANRLRAHEAHQRLAAAPCCVSAVLPTTFPVISSQYIFIPFVVTSASYSGFLVCCVPDGPSTRRGVAHLITQAVAHMCFIIH